MKALTNKAQHTQDLIVVTAIQIARECGLSAVSVRNIASRLAISKSGVFNRISSIEELQVAVIEEYGKSFLNDVFHPSMIEARGIPRLTEIIRRWIDRVSQYRNIGEAIFEAAAFSATPLDAEIGKRSRELSLEWVEITRKCANQALEEGHFKKNTNIEDLVFDLHSVLLGTLYASAFLKNEQAAGQGHKLYFKLITPSLTSKGKRLLPPPPLPPAG